MSTPEVTPEKLDEMIKEAATYFERGHRPEMAATLAALKEYRARNFPVPKTTTKKETTPMSKMSKSAAESAATASAILAQLDADVAQKEFAAASADGFGRGIAKTELRQARARRTKLKMMVSEKARESDPAMIARRLNGQGVPLLTNSHALGDDTDLSFS